MRWRYTSLLSASELMPAGHQALIFASSELRVFGAAMEGQ